MISHDFALAIMDVQMPGMSGFELAELMRGAKKTKSIPIIFVTAATHEQSFSFKGYESGAVDFLLKPLDAHAVRSKAKVFTELYQQKKELKSMEAKFRGLLEAAPDAIVIVNEAGRIELVNRQTDVIFGYERAELMGQPMEMLLPERFRKNHVHLRTVYTENPSSRPMASRDLNLFGRRKDGSEFSIDISLSPLETENGTLISAAIRDISARRTLEKEQADLMEKLKNAQTELEEAVQIRDEFMSIASHELKTPLTALQTQMRRRRLSKGDFSAFTPEHLTKMFATDERQLARITHLIDDMLDITRISSGKLCLRTEEFDLCALVREVADQNSEQFLAAGCELKVETCDSLSAAWDRFRIEQVIANLFTNAIRYGAGKPVLAQVSGFPGGARITVSDQGRGIAEENHERIFQRFERAVGNDVSGLGLGLYIVKQILNAHKGSIRVISELGKGATFIVELPLT
jgi:two-component system sensor kinase FixL